MNNYPIEITLKNSLKDILKTIENRKVELIAINRIRIQDVKEGQFKEESHCRYLFIIHEENSDCAKILLHLIMGCS